MMNTPHARLTGIDLARGLAIIGMIVAHVGASDMGPISRFFWVADGRPSALFAVLAGWGLHFMTSRVFGDAARLTYERQRLVRRSLALVVLGFIIETFLPTPVAVILVPYAFMFILALPFLGRSTRTTAISAVVIVAAGPFLVASARYALDGIYYVGGTYVPFAHSLLTGYYPAITWLGYLLAGLTAGRLMDTGRLVGLGREFALLASGLLLVVIGYGGGLALQTLSGNVIAPGFNAGTMAEAYLSVEPHSGSPFELVGNTGFAFVVIAVCLMVCRSRVVKVLSFPIRATGQMSLSSYVLHLIIIFVLVMSMPVIDVIDPASHAILAVVAVPVSAVASLWVALVGQGPLERLLRKVAGSRAA